MKVNFSFGKNGIDVTVPDTFQTNVIHSRTGDALADEAAALAQALDNPIGSLRWRCSPPARRPWPSPFATLPARRPTCHPAAAS